MKYQSLAAGNYKVCFHFRCPTLSFPAVLLTGISSVLNGVLLVDLDNQCTKRLADFPEDMIYMGAEYLEGKIVTLGGNNGGTVSSYSYDPATDEWSSLPDFPFVM